MPRLFSAVGLLPFCRWQSQSDESFWNATAFTMDTSTLPACQEDLTGGTQPSDVLPQQVSMKCKCLVKRRRVTFSRAGGFGAEPELRGIPGQWGITNWKKEWCDCTVNVNAVLRVSWSGPSQAAGSERQHHRVPAEECGPWHRVCPDSLCAVWICGGAWYLCYLQNLWVPVFNMSPTPWVFIFLVFLCRLIAVIHVPSFSSSAPLGYVSNFKVISYTSTSIDVEWSPIVGATEYKLSWNTGDIFTHIVQSSSPTGRLLMCFHMSVKQTLYWCSYQVIEVVGVTQNSYTICDIVLRVSACLQMVAALSPVTWTAVFSSIASKTWTHSPPTRSPSAQCTATQRDQISP